MRFILLLTLLPTALPAQSLDGLTWPEQKCVLYERAVDSALSMQGPDGISESFIAANDAFIASGCTGPHNVCPRNPEEIALADNLTLMTMFEGMASTFVPFGCPSGT